MSQKIKTFWLKRNNIYLSFTAHYKIQQWNSVTELACGPGIKCSNPTSTIIFNVTILKLFVFLVRIMLIVISKDPNFDGKRLFFTLYRPD